MKKISVYPFLLFFFFFIGGFVNDLYGQRFDDVFNSIKNENTYQNAQLIIYRKDSSTFTIANTKDKLLDIKTINKTDSSLFFREAILNGLTNYSLYDSIYSQNRNNPEVRNGILSEIRELSRKNKCEVGLLSFTYTKHIVHNGNKLIFSEQFFNNISFSEQYPVKHTNGNKFVIFVHDPHFMVEKQYYLLDGLKYFLNDNKGFNFHFLVEGYFEEENKNMPTSPTLGILSQETPKEYQIYNLLDNYLIDVPFAYRLLYDNQLPATAIDNPEIIKQEVKFQTGNYRNIIERSLSYSGYKSMHNLLSTKIKNNSTKLDSTSKNISSNLALNFLYLSGVFSEDDTKEKVEGIKELSIYTSEFSQSLKKLDSQLFHDECLYFDSLSAALELRYQDWRLGLERDITMSKNINSFLSNNANTIPIVFIGNFHTQALINSLPNDVGYIVIEPNGGYFADFNAFHNATDYENKKRLKYIKNVDFNSNELKLPVSPLKRELGKYKNKIKEIVTEFKNLENKTLNRSIFSKEVMSKINGSVRNNAILNNFEIIEGKSKPANYENAFASISIKNNRFLIHDLNSTNWGENIGRERYIKEIKPMVFDDTKKQISYYLENSTNKLFFSVFDEKYGEIYLFERNMDNWGKDFLWLPLHHTEMSNYFLPLNQYIIVYE